MGEGRVYEFDVTGKALRGLYEELSGRIVSAINAGERRFHAVFPSGADRMRVVASVLSATRRKAIIISPNAARCAYWTARRIRRADLYDAAASTWTNVPGPLVSTNPYSCAPVLTLRYSQLFASRIAGQENEAFQRFMNHAVRQGYTLFVLDDCAALPEQWSAELMEFLRTAEQAVIGFSHTAPDETSAWFRLCADSVKLDIPVPVVALQGALALYRHHVYFQRVAGADVDPARLVQSSSKIEPALEIIAREVQLHNADARIAIVMDATALTHVRAGDVLDGASVMRKMAVHRHLAAQAVVMLTGASVIVPAGRQTETLAAMQREIQLREWDIELHVRSGEAFAEITGNGRDWNSAVYVELVYGLLRHGLAGCVLLAPDVLFWGLERLAFNTLIDLTSGTRQHYVHIPEHAKEVAVKSVEATVNYWDIVCLTATGGSDWKRFLTKHTYTECPAEEQVVEIGPGAVDVRLPGMNPAMLAESTNAWNDLHLSRAAHRMDWAGVWKRTHCTDTQSQTVVVVPWDTCPEKLHCEAAVRDLLAEDTQTYAARSASMKLHHTLWTVTAVSAGLIGFLTLTRENGVYVALAILLFLIVKIVTKWWSVRGARPRTLPVERAEYFHRAAMAVYRAHADSIEQTVPFSSSAVQLTVREDGTYRVVFDIPDTTMAAVCLESFRALFAPANEPVYTLAVFAFHAGKKRMQSILAAKNLGVFYTPHYLVAVPAYFHQSRAHAEVFRASWEEYMGHAVIHSGTEGLPDIPRFREICPSSVRVALCRR